MSIWRNSWNTMIRHTEKWFTQNSWHTLRSEVFDISLLDTHVIKMLDHDREAYAGWRGDTEMSARGFLKELPVLLSQKLRKCAWKGDFLWHKATVFKVCRMFLMCEVWDFKETLINSATHLRTSALSSRRQQILDVAPLHLRFVSYIGTAYLYKSGRLHFISVSLK